MHFDYEGHTGIAVLIVIHPCTRASGHVQAICACASLYLQDGICCADSIKTSVCSCDSQHCQVSLALSSFFCQVSFSWLCVVKLDCWDYPAPFRSPWSLDCFKLSWSFAHCKSVGSLLAPSRFCCFVKILCWSCWTDSGRIDRLGL